MLTPQKSTLILADTYLTGKATYIQYFTVLEAR